MFTKDINKMFTEKIAEYIGKGYRINVGTMAGHQGEIAKVDMTDGNEIIRIILESFDEIGKDYYNLRGIRLLVGKCTEKRIRPDVSRTDQTIWDSDLEQIEAQNFYCIGDNRYDNYYGTKEEALNACKKRRARQGNYDYGSKHIELTSEKAVDIVIPFIRKVKGIKRVNRSDVRVEKVFLKDGCVKYGIVYRDHAYYLN